MTDPVLRPGSIQWTPEVPDNGEANRVLEHAGVLDDSQRDLVLHQTETVLSKCVPPTDEAGTITGLVIGQVQSGKTLSFTTLAALAHDNGYRGVVLLAGTKTNLRDQNTDRLISDLNADESPAWEVCRLVNGNQAAIHETSIKSRLTQWDQDFVQEAQKRTLVFTLLKNRANLDRLSGLLGRLGAVIEKSPFIIIDDESDQASLNTQPQEDEESATYAAIQRLRDCIPQHSYVQYTATPQANALISLGDHLSPNFVEVLEPGTGYCGGDVFFSGQREYLDLIPVDDEVDANHLPPQIPESLRSAFGVFVVGTASRIATGDTGIKSMLIHPHMNTIFHELYSNFVSLLRDSWSTTLEDDPGDSEVSLLHAEFETYRQELITTDPSIPDIVDLTDPIRYVLSELRIKVLNSRPGRDTEVNWGSASVHVLVGGQALERGFTVKGLTVSYMPRPLGVGNTDTVQQRGRFFGYRQDLLPVTRVYLPASIQYAFGSYIEHERDFRTNIADFASSGDDFSNWSRRFIIDGALQPTRRNVINLPHFRTSLREWTQLLPDFDNAASVDSFIDVADLFTSGASWGDPGNRDWEYDTEKDGSRVRHHVASATIQDVLDALLKLRSPMSDQYSALIAALGVEARQSGAINANLFKMRRGEVGDRRAGSGGRYNLHVGRSGSYPGDNQVFVPTELTVQIHRFHFERNDGSKTPELPAFAIRLPRRLRVDVIEQDED